MNLEKYGFGMGDRFLHQGRSRLQAIILANQAGGEGVAIAKEVNGSSSEQYVQALRHDRTDPACNLHLRQLLHVGYKVAAKMGDRYYRALRDFESDVVRNVTENFWRRHIRPLFID